MFDNLNGGDERISFLVEYLVTKGVITMNAATWINRSGGSLGLKTDFFLKSVNKLAVVQMMDGIDYESYSKVLNENLTCKRCSGQVTVKNTSFISTFNCEKCGTVKDKDGVEIDFTKVQDIVNARTAKDTV